MIMFLLFLLKLEKCESVTCRWRILNFGGGVLFSFQDKVADFADKIKENKRGIFSCQKAKTSSLQVNQFWKEGKTSFQLIKNRTDGWPVRGLVSSLSGLTVVRKLYRQVHAIKKLNPNVAKKKTP